MACAGKAAKKAGRDFLPPGERGGLDEGGEWAVV
jgi:hypothetical protein